MSDVLKIPRGTLLRRSVTRPKPNVIYHVTTPKKFERYKATGRILPPIRGFDTIRAAEVWAEKTQRTIILAVRPEGDVYPLPDHHLPEGCAWWCYDHGGTAWDHRRLERIAKLVKSSFDPHVWVWAEQGGGEAFVRARMHTPHKPDTIYYIWEHTEEGDEEYPATVHDVHSALERVFGPYEMDRWPRIETGYELVQL